MPDYSDTTADQMGWKPVPIPTEDVSAQCRIAPVRFSVKSDLTTTIGWRLEPGQTLRIKSGQAAFIRPDVALGGVLVIESIT